MEGGFIVIGVSGLTVAFVRLVNAAPGFGGGGERFGAVGWAGFITATAAFALAAWAAAAPAQ